MDFRKLQAFAKVYENRGFSKAGAELFLSQPTVSAHVASLEEELGVRLFDRLGRLVLPTREAGILYAAARDVFARLEAVTAELQQSQGRIVGDVLVGGSTIPAHYILPGHLAAFARRYPEAHVRLHAGDTAVIAAQVAAGELALGVVGADPETPELRTVPLLEDDLVVIAPPETNSTAPLSWERLAGQPWVLREEGSGTRRAGQEAWRRMGRALSELRPSAVVDSTEAVLRCVRAGLGLGVVSRLASTEGVRRNEFVELVLPDFRPRRGFWLITRTGRTLSPAERAFIHLLTEGK
jgi:DNA-binding transcriptional LysR family regulator